MEKIVDKYFDLIIRAGVNIQKGQKLLINSPIECAEYARIAMQKAYDAGAKHVVINWNDEKAGRITYLNADDSIFDYAEPWVKKMLDTLSREGCAVLSIAASDPEILKGVDTDKIMRKTKASNQALVEYRTRMMSNINRWCVVSVPTKAWAAKVFPSEPTPEKAVEKLWEAILKASRADGGDPAQEWKQHSDTLRKRSQILNDYNFDYIHLTNAVGTDLKIKLPKNHIWAGGEEKDEQGICFSPNIPTEEIFTAPEKTGVEGVVKSAKPLVYGGNIIDNFTVWFENGKAVKVAAEQNGALLEKLISADENAPYLGEIALVPYHSPISLSKILFFNTLFDENASCHLAFGKAYPHSVKDTTGKSKEELEAMGLNDSQIHVDFMIGTEDMEIVGVAGDKEVQIFKNGDFVF